MLLIVPTCPSDLLFDSLETGRAVTERGHTSGEEDQTRPTAELQPSRRVDLKKEVTQRQQQKSSGIEGGVDGG